MDYKFNTQGIWTSAKNCAIVSASKFASGITFKEIFEAYKACTHVLIPTAMEYVVDCFVAFFLFHLYLFYVLIFSLSRSIWKRFKIKGNRLALETNNTKDKVGMALTYFLVFQSFSKWTLGVPGLDKIMGWALQIRPQINIKPQIKIGKKSESKESVVSVKNKIDTSIDLAFESEDDSTRKTMKKLRKASNSVSFATDLMKACSDEEEESENEESDNDSMILVQKWLEDQSSTDTKTVNTHLLKIVAEDVIKRRSFAKTKSGIKDLSKC